MTSLVRLVSILLCWRNTGNHVERMGFSLILKRLNMRHYVLCTNSYVGINRDSILTMRSTNPIMQWMGQ